MRETQKVSQSNCFVTHWAAEMRFLNWWSSFDTSYFKAKKDIYCFLAATSAENYPSKSISVMSEHGGDLKIGGGLGLLH